MHSGKCIYINKKYNNVNPLNENVRSISGNLCILRSKQFAFMNYVIQKQLIIKYLFMEKNHQKNLMTRNIIKSFFQLYLGTPNSFL